MSQDASGNDPQMPGCGQKHAGGSPSFWCFPPLSSLQEQPGDSGLERAERGHCTPSNAVRPVLSAD